MPLRERVPSSKNFKYSDLFFQNESWVTDAMSKISKFVKSCVYCHLSFLSGRVPGTHCQSSAGTLAPRYLHIYHYQELSNKVPYEVLSQMASFSFQISFIKYTMGMKATRI